MMPPRARASSGSLAWLLQRRNLWKFEHLRDPLVPAHFATRHATPPADRSHVLRALRAVSRHASIMRLGPARVQIEANKWQS